jgi:NAD+ kinase
MKKIGIICKEGSAGPAEILKDFVPWLEKKGITVFIDRDAAAAIGRKGHPRAEVPSLSDLVLVLGGDGTILSVARLACERGIPILGVNLGGLGFITEVYKDDIYAAMESALTGNCPFEERMMLSTNIVRHGERIAEYNVLNDVVINKGGTAKILDIEAYVDSSLMTSFRADGLIAATPTGSTAYSLSAGGPVLYPTVESIVLTPICSHSLAMRPIVLPQEAVVEIRHLTEGAEVYLAMDGQVGFSLRERDSVMIRKSPCKTRLLMPFKRDYFKVLREKLKWGSR